jgi:anaerobic selenocysteine-containing dehydrogenase
MAHVDPSISRTPIADHAADLATCCVLCSHNCGLRVDVEDGRIVAVRADPDSPMTGGYVCNKAVTIPSYVRHAQRVEHPLRRRADVSFERVSWDEAIADIARRLRAIRERHTPRAIGLVGVG